MNKEKMRVLEMLDNGKITADEAANLLEVLGRSRFISDETRGDVEEKVNQFAQDLSKFAKDCGCKIQVLYKDAEPKLKKASQSVLAKAAAALDTLASNINESLEAEEACCGEEGCGCDGTPEDAPVEN